MMQPQLSPARIESILTAVARVREFRSLTVKQFQKLLGLMAAASNMIPFGLMCMRPLQRWLIPGHLNQEAAIPSRQGPRPREWRLHPDVMCQIWRMFGQAQVDLFATRETLHCPLWFFLTHAAPLGLDAMVQTWPRLHLYAFPRLL